MTSKLTITDDKLSALLSEMEKSFTRCQGHGYTGAAEEYADMISALRELQERRKAEQDSEPVELEVLSGVLVNERWMHQSLPNGWHDLFACRHAQPAPVVPEEKPMPNPLSMYAVDAVAAIAEAKGWNACRAAMLQAGNSPVIPDGYVMVPKEPTQAMCAAFNDSDYGRKSLRERYVAILAAAPQEVK